MPPTKDCHFWAWMWVPLPTLMTVSNSADAVSRLGSCVNSFCSANPLKLNTGKTEAVSFSEGCPPDTTLQIASDSVYSQLQIKCLGAW